MGPMTDADDVARPGDGPPSAGRRDEPDVFRPFRPVRGRFVVLGFALLLVVVFAGVAFVLPGDKLHGQWTLFDRIMIAGFGVVIAACVSRFAAIRAVPTRQTLTVRNLLTTRTLEWSEIVGVQFAGADPWVSLDLADTEELAVMAIQRADGRRARQEAARLAALVAALGEFSEPPSPPDAGPPTGPDGTP